MKKSSIEWYAKQLAKIGLTDEVIGHLTKEAKEMHRQEVIDAWENGYTHGASANDEPSIYHGTQYYKNTYEKEN